MCYIPVIQIRNIINLWYIYCVNSFVGISGFVPPSWSGPSLLILQCLYKCLLSVCSGGQSTRCTNTMCADWGRKPAGTSHTSKHCLSPSWVVYCACLTRLAVIAVQLGRYQLLWKRSVKHSDSCLGYGKVLHSYLHSPSTKHFVCFYNESLP